MADCGFGAFMVESRRTLSTPDRLAIALTDPAGTSAATLAIIHSRLMWTAPSFFIWLIKGGRSMAARFRSSVRTRTRLCSLVMVGCTSVFRLVGGGVRLTITGSKVAGSLAATACSNAGSIV